MGKELKNDLKNDYENAVQAYVRAFCKQMDMRFGFWIGDEVGGMADFDDYYTLRFDDVKLCVDEAVDYATLAEWYAYCVDVGELGINATIPNLKSWLMGFRGLGKADMERFRQMKGDLLAEAEKLAEKSRKGGF